MAMMLPISVDEANGSIWSGTASLVVRYLDLWLAGEVPGPPTNTALPEPLLLTACEFLENALAALSDRLAGPRTVRRAAEPFTFARREAELACLSIATEVFAAQWPQEAAASDSVRAVLETCRDTLHAVHGGERSEALREAVQRTRAFFGGLLHRAVSGRYVAFAAASIEV